MTRKLPPLFVAIALVAAMFLANGVATIPEAFAQALPGGSTAPSGANIRQTRHNLSPSAPSRQVTSGNSSTTEPVLTSTSTSEVCVYCHTPHGASQSGEKPLWNRADSSSTYSSYTSSSLDASDLDLSDLATPSKLCLSCHDGSIAIGAVSNAPGPGAGSQITFPAANFGTTASDPAGSMPFGRNQANADHGYTRRLGDDLRNDHPISFTYDSNLATADGELRNPTGSASPTLIADRVVGSPKPNFPLTGGKVQCSTCHDPHRNTQKFLLKNRLVQGVPGGQAWGSWSFDDATDQICMGCHTRLGKAWQQSAHADRTVASEAYNDGDAAMRDFPTSTEVWQAGCLNCHDTHTVAGSRRLLREGVDTGSFSVTSGGIGYAASVRSGLTTTSDYNATSALENTCYQCHSGSPVINAGTLSATEGVPNIQAEFARTYRMPIVNDDQGDSSFGNTAEVHDITNADGAESQTSLGFGNAGSRHAECTDCHNPHRVVKADTFLGGSLSGGDTTRRTHVPARGTDGSQGNIASGALRGAWGVEPSYTATGQTTVTTSSVWPEAPTFTVKKGDPAGATTLPSGTAGTNSVEYLTREYQLCFKCHSNYANGPLASDFPQLKSAGRGGTPTGTNSVTRYTNVAAEFATRAEDPPATGLDQGENGNDTAYTPSSPNGAPNGAANNHRSWHPVVFPTGRTRKERTNSDTSGAFGNIRAPFNVDAKIGKQTMHCSDCHGNSGGLAQAPTTAGASSWIRDSGPNLAQVQGPHGSESPFLLKGSWSTSTTLPGTAANTQFCGNCHNPQGGSGFAGGGEASHTSSKKVGRPCMWCHIAVPHGWRNKAFLVNLNCVGSEGGGSGCQSNLVGNTSSLTAGPYYVAARLRVKTWQASTSWTENSCDYPGGSKGGDWMTSTCGDQ